MSMTGVLPISLSEDIIRLTVLQARGKMSQSPCILLLGSCTFVLLDFLYRMYVMHLYRIPPHRKADLCNDYRGNLQLLVSTFLLLSRF